MHTRLRRDEHLVRDRMETRLNTPRYNAPMGTVHHRQKSRRPWPMVLGDIGSQITQTTGLLQLL
jgi:hypothetical protein